MITLKFNEILLKSMHGEINKKSKDFKIRTQNLKLVTPDFKVLFAR